MTAKNNAREVRAIATINTEVNKDMCDTQKNIIVAHTKNDAKKVNDNQLYHKFSNDTRQRNDSQFNRVPKMQVIMEILNSNKKDLTSS